MSRRRTWIEITIVLMLSLGGSALYSVLQIIDDLSQTTPLGEQSTALNTSTTTVQYVDLARQLVGIARSTSPRSRWSATCSGARPARHLRRLGIDRFRVRPDLGGAALIALCIGVPGLALYFRGAGARFHGRRRDPAALNTYWWTIPVLLLSAIRSGLQEEVIVSGTCTSASEASAGGGGRSSCRPRSCAGSYHLYQGFGAFVATPSWASSSGGSTRSGDGSCPSSSRTACSTPWCSSATRSSPRPSPSCSADPLTARRPRCIRPARVQRAGAWFPAGRPSVEHADPRGR